MAFKKRYASGGKGKKKYTSIRLTGLFGTKKPGMYVGTARPEEVEQLIEKCNEALEADKGVTFFLFKNKDRESDIAYSLAADVQQDLRASKNRRSERIEEDDEEQEQEQYERSRKRSNGRRDEDEDEDEDRDNDDEDL